MMEAREITELKDSILLYLFDCAKWRISLAEIYYDLDLENIPREVIHDYIEGMVSGKLISCYPISGGRNLYSITERGKMRLKERGYTKFAGKELENTGNSRPILSKL